jgi:hypothetical protein
MRRTVVLCASLAALVVPAVALAMHGTSGDGTLVVKDGSAPRGAPVVTLVIKGAAIGQVAQGSVVIEDLTPGDGFTSEVTGATWRKDGGDTIQRAGGQLGFRFRAVGGSYFKITLYGSGVDLVASGRGTVILAGSPDLPKGDGLFSLNGGDFRSLPALATNKLAVGLPLPTSG